MKSKRQGQPLVRTAARALIVHDGQLLTIEMQRRGAEVFYILPGGGQAHGETLEASLRRECREEIGVCPQIGPIAYVREYIGKHHAFHAVHRDFHQVEVVFHCTLEDPGSIGDGCELDRHQIGLRWIRLRELHSVAFFPRVIIDHIDGDRIVLNGSYLGDIN